MGARCDFCNTDAKPAVWSYPTHDIEIEEINKVCRGVWLACDDCAALIETEDKQALCDRTISALGNIAQVVDGKMRMVPREEIIRRIAPIHELFFANRLGIGHRIM